MDAETSGCSCLCTFLPARPPDHLTAFLPAHVFASLSCLPAFLPAWQNELEKIGAQRAGLEDMLRSMKAKVGGAAPLGPLRRDMFGGCMINCGGIGGVALSLCSISSVSDSYVEDVKRADLISISTITY